MWIDTLYIFQNDDENKEDEIWRMISVNSQITMSTLAS